MLFKKKATDQLAFNRIPAFRKFELFMERYRSAGDDFITPHIQNIKEPRILDVGSGNGSIKYFLPQHLPIELVGIELDPERIESCKRLGYKRIESFNIEKTNFPFEDNYFDVIIAMHVVEHLYNPNTAIQEIYRCLKKDGILIIGVPMHTAPVAFFQRLKEIIFPSKWWEHHQFYTLKSLQKAFNQYNIIDVRGFRIISSRKRFSWEDRLGFYKFNTWWGKRFPGLSSEVNIIIKK